MSHVVIDKYKLDMLASVIGRKSGETVPMTIAEMTEAVEGIEQGGSTPTLQSKTYTVDSAGTETITADSGYDGLSSVAVSVPQADFSVSYGNSGFITENTVRKWKIETFAYAEPGGWVDEGGHEGGIFKCNAVPANTTVTPTESAQSIGGYDYMMEGAVTVNAIPSNYVGTGITRRSSSDLTASGATVTVPSGYYSAQATKSVASGTAGTPTAAKGTVSNHQVSVTPSVTNTSGYIIGSTINGTAVTVSASELVSGDLPITQNGNSIDCANYSTVSVNVPSGGSSWAHIAHTTLTVNSTSTSAASAGTLSCGTDIVTKDKIIYVRVRDQEGARAGYFAGSDAYFMNYNKANGSTSAFAVPAVLCYRYTTSSAWAGTAGQYGVYGYSISNAGVLTIRRRYNSNYSLTINSTYDVDVFTLDYPTGYPAVFDL